MRSRGGGHKRLYRMVDFKRTNLDTPGIVKTIEYDPNRSARIALVEYPECPDNRLAYIIAPRDLLPDQVIVASRSRQLEIKVGNAMLLKHIPLGALVHNVELYPWKGGQFGRAAGDSCQVESRHTKKPYVQVKLSSGERRLIHENCMATIGVVSNPFHGYQQLGKAGRSRWLGRRPRTRGVAMNPVDHPHGGGEGKTKGRPSCSKWGWTCKGRKTRSKKKKDWRIVMRRVKKRKTK